MHSLETIRQIDRLLRQGQMSQRDIAARLGVSRGTVSAIANGERGLHGKHGDDASQSPRHPSGTPVRCPECGYRTYRPCLVCNTRKHRREQQAKIIATLSKNRGNSSR
jgi:Helix-turn-helix domain